MAYFLALQTTYHALELALFKANHIIETITIPKVDASKMLIPSIDILLQKNALTLNDLACVVVNQGPGPFTTLRVVIATANSLNFALKIPLIGIDGLQALLTEHADPTFACNVAMLNAFHNDVYAGIRTLDSVTTSCIPYTTLLESLYTAYPHEQIKIFGNGAELYTKEIHKALGSYAVIPSPLPQTVSIDMIGLLGWQAWQQQKGITHFLQPLYLKLLAPTLPQ